MAAVCCAVALDVLPSRMFVTEAHVTTLLPLYSLLPSNMPIM